MIELVKYGKRVKLKVNIKAIDRKKLTPRQVDEALAILVTDIKRKTPVDTGQLRNSIRKRKTAKGGEIYINGKRNNEVAEYLIEGTKRHFVKPKKKKALAWWTGSGMAFSTGHWVKGIRKGYWKFAPTKTAIKKFTERLSGFIRAKRG